jgi:hypothetical protein
MKRIVIPVIAPETINICYVDESISDSSNIVVLKSSDAIKSTYGLLKRDNTGSYIFESFTVSGNWHSRGANKEDSIRRTLSNNPYNFEREIYVFYNIKEFAAWFAKEQGV